MERNSKETSEVLGRAGSIGSEEEDEEEEGKEAGESEFKLSMSST